MTTTEETTLLLESLIRMVGRSNQHVDSLQQRVAQLEWLVREQQYESSTKVSNP